MRRQKTIAAVRGAAMASGTLYSVTPMSERIWLCQYCPRAKEMPKSTTTLMTNTRQAPGRGGRGPRSAKARQIEAASTPSPYPMAALMPHTIPLEEAAAREQRGSERQAREEQRTPTARQGRVELPADLAGGRSGRLPLNGPRRRRSAGTLGRPFVLDLACHGASSTTARGDAIATAHASTPRTRRGPA